MRIDHILDRLQPDRHPRQIMAPKMPPMLHAPPPSLHPAPALTHDARMNQCLPQHDIKTGRDVCIQMLYGCSVCRGLVGGRGRGCEWARHIGVCANVLRVEEGLGSSRGKKWRGMLVVSCTKSPVAVVD